MNKDECRAEFPLKKADILIPQEIFQFPEELIMYKRLKVDTTEAICTLVKRVAYPCRYSDMVPKFARLIRELCVIIKTVMQKLYQEWRFLLNSLNREGLRPESLQRYADAVHENGAGAL